MVGCGVVSKHRARCMNDVRTYVRTITTYSARNQNLSLVRRQLPRLG